MANTSIDWLLIPRLFLISVYFLIVLIAWCIIIFGFFIMFVVCSPFILLGEWISEAERRRNKWKKNSSQL